MTILLVEDEALIALKEAEILEQEGYQVLTVYTAENAIEITDSSEEIDLILMDIDLGRGHMDGTEAARIILQHHDIPIVFLSNRTEPDIIEKTEKITSYGFIVKSSVKTVLLTSIRTAFRLHTAHMELKAKERFRAIADYTYDWEDWLGVDSKLLWVNPAVERITGYTPKECYAMPDYPLPLIHKGDIDISTRDIETSIKQQASYQDREVRCVCKDGTIKWLSVCWQPMYNAEGDYLGLRSSMRDITEKKQAEERLQTSEANLRSLIETSDDSIALRDKDGRLLLFNETFEYLVRTLFHMEPSPGVRTIDYQTEENRRFWEQRIEQVLAGNRVHEQYTYPFGNGEKRTYDIVFTPVFKDQTVIGYSEITRDITALKELEATLRESEQKYRLIVDNASETISSIDADGRFIVVNRAAAKNVDRDPNYFIGKTLWDVMPGEDADQRYANIKEVIETGCEKRAEVQLHIGNTEQYFQSHIQPIVDNSGTVHSVLILSTEITEQRKRKKELEYLNTLLTVQQETSLDAILVVDENDCMIYFNRRFIEMWQIPREILETGSRFKVQEAVGHMVVDYDLFVEKNTYLYKNRFEISEKEIELTDGRTLFRYAAPLIGPDRHFYGRIWFYRDITDYKRALKEKDVLMQEIHHRVKNNLANIVALAHIELSNTQKSKEQSIEDLINRIESIELMHELLYTGESLYEIRADRYIERLTDKTSVFFQEKRPDIRVHYDIEPVTLTTKLTTIFGIILSELLTNTFKYAVSEDGIEINIALQRTDCEYRFMYSDSGTGLPKHIKHIDDLKQGTGIMLIREFIHGLDGSVELDTSKGTAFLMSFPR